LASGAVEAGDVVARIGFGKFNIIFNELIRSEFQRLFNVYLFGRKFLNSLRDKRRKRLFRSEGTLPRLGTGWRSIDPLDVEF